MTGLEIYNAHDAALELAALDGATDSKAATFSPEVETLLRGGAETAAGVQVSLRSALQVGAVMACVRVIAEDVAKLPLHLKRLRIANGRETSEAIADHPMVSLLREPNEFMTAQDLLEVMVGAAAAVGEGYALKTGDPNDPYELWPLLPGQCMFRRDLYNQTGDAYFDIWHVDGTHETVKANQLLRLKGFGFDPFQGFNIVQEARETIALNSQIVRAQARFYGKDQRPSGVLTSKTPIGNDPKNEARERIRQQWQTIFGPGGPGGIAILDGDWTYAALTVSAADADTMKLWEAMIADACRVFRVSPVKVMQAAGAVSYNSLEQTNQNHLTDTLEPWLIRIEQGFGRDLLTSEERHGDPRRGRLEWVFDRNEFVRPLPKDRFDIYTKARQASLMSVNDIRAAEDLPRIEDARADDPFAPVATNPGGNPATSKQPAKAPAAAQEDQAP